MSIEINGKVYRNLPEQVEKNKDDIEKLKVYYPFGGPYATTTDIPSNVLIDDGKYLIGDSEPYTIYQYDEENEDFIDLGTFADPTDYIAKTGNVTGITGQKIFSHGSGVYTKTITFNKDNNSSIELEGGTYNRSNQTKPKLVINPNYMHMSGAASNTTYTDAATTIGNGEIAINAPSTTGDELILNTYGGTQCNFAIVTKKEGGTTNPAVHVNKYELRFATNLAKTYTEYHHGYVMTSATSTPTYIIEVTKMNPDEILSDYSTNYIFDAEPNKNNVHVATKEDICAKVPDAPTVDGTYTLKVTVSDGTPTYSWVLDN